MAVNLESCSKIERCLVLDVIHFLAAESDKQANICCRMKDTCGKDSVCQWMQKFRDSVQKLNDVP
jgi:hypothetical protein